MTPILQSIVRTCCAVRRIGRGLGGLCMHATVLARGLRQTWRQERPTRILLVPPRHTKEQETSLNTRSHLQCTTFCLRGHVSRTEAESIKGLMGLRISQPKQAKPSDWIAQALRRRTRSVGPVVPLRNLISIPLTPAAQY
jgi:hypothetical protein